MRPFSLGDVYTTGENILAARAARDPNNLQNQLLRARLNEFNQPQGFDIGQVNPRDFTASSIQKFRQTGDFNDLERYSAPKSAIRIDEGDAWGFYHPVTNDLLRRVPKQLGPAQTPEYKKDAAAAAEEGKQDVRLATEPKIEFEKTTQRESANRQQGFINDGLAAADALPTINRGIELLESGVKTGGFDNLKLWATDTLGITGADEGELSANLGKAVLSQLRSTFGAQFTQQEGERLARIEAGFGKSPAVNLRLMRNILQITTKAAKRGAAAAKDAGDDSAFQAIQDAMNFRLGEPAAEDMSNYTDEQLKAILAE